MGTVQQLAVAVEAGLRAAHPTLRKTVVTEVALAVGAMIEAQTPNTVELANRLPLPTERQDRREQWLRRLLHISLMPAIHFTGRRPASSVEGGGAFQAGRFSVGAQRRSEQVFTVP